MNALPLAIPPACLKQHLVVLGKTGAGKSSALRHIVEHLLSKVKRVCIIDPKGDWHGLTSSADGKSEGFPVLMFGDFKNKRSDVPMDGRAGKTVAEVICSSNQSCVLGFRGWMPGDLTRFWIDFASTIFNHNAGELFLVVDEVHNFAAKGKIMDPDAGKCLHWTNRLASEGRGLNIKLLIASQRPQKVHNDTLTSCETLVAMRVIHEADREAIKSWIDGCGDREHGKQVLAELAQMKRGEAWVWSPEAGVLERVTFPMFTTFDSFSEHATTAPKRFAAVDVEKVKEKLARVIDEAKANDPRELRVMLQVMQMRLQSIGRKVGLSTFKSDADYEQVVLTTAEALKKPAEVAKEVSVFTESDRTALDNLHAKVSHMHEASRDVERVLLEAMKRQTAPQPAPTPTRRNIGGIAPFARAQGETELPKPRRTNGSAPADSSLPEGERKILTAAAQYPDGATREQLTVLTGYKKSTRDAYILRLMNKGYLGINANGIIANRAGIDALGPNFEPLPTGAALREYWIARLPEGERRILEEAILVYPQTHDRASLEASTGYKKSTRDAYILRLAVKKLLTTPAGGIIRASDNLFD